MKADDILKTLVSGTPQEKSNTLYAIHGGSSPDPRIVSAVETLLDDRSLVQMYIPYRYGELRCIAADTLAEFRAVLRDFRPVVLPHAPSPMTSDRMAEAFYKAGLDRAVTGAIEGYAELVALGLVRMNDEMVFDPTEYLDPLRDEELKAAPRGAVLDGASTPSSPVAPSPGHRTVPVVEFRSFDGDTEKVMARFVLVDGVVQLVGCTPNGARVVDEMTGRGVPGAKGSYVKPEAGRAFLELLAGNFRGIRFFATRVFEMDEGEAMRGYVPPTGV